MLSCRCLGYASVQQVHLYDPAGHLKRCKELLQESLAELAAQEGRSIQIKVRQHSCKHWAGEPHGQALLNSVPPPNDSAQASPTV